jgi:hypothetical protein
MSEEKTTRLWLWKNGDHYLAFDNPCPTYSGGDPMTLGEPVAIAILTPSIPGWRKWNEQGQLDECL